MQVKVWLAVDEVRHQLEAGSHMGIGGWGAVQKAVVCARQQVIFHLNPGLPQLPEPDLEIGRAHV